MKKIVVYAALLAAALLLPSKGTDVGKLLPVEVLAVDQKDGWVVLETDTQDAGMGRTVKEAVENLKETTAGIVFLDTADYLLVSPQAADAVEALRPYLKKSVRLCTVEGQADLEAAAAFLAVHPPRTRLKAYRDGMNLQTLRCENGRMILTEKSEKSA